MPPSIGEYLAGRSEGKRKRSGPARGCFRRATYPGALEHRTHHEGGEKQRERNDDGIGRRGGGAERDQLQHALGQSVPLPKVTLMSCAAAGIVAAASTNAAAAKRNPTMRGLAITPCRPVGPTGLPSLPPDCRAPTWARPVCSRPRARAAD